MAIIVWCVLLVSLVWARACITAIARLATVRTAITGIFVTDTNAKAASTARNGHYDNQQTR